MTEADLLEKVSIVTEHRSGILCVRERRDRVGLGTAVAKPMDDLV